MMTLCKLRQACAKVAPFIPCTVSAIDLTSYAANKTTKERGGGVLETASLVKFQTALEIVPCLKHYNKT